MRRVIALCCDFRGPSRRRVCACVRVKVGWTSSACRGRRRRAVTSHSVDIPVSQQLRLYCIIHLSIVLQIEIRRVASFASRPLCFELSKIIDVLIARVRYKIAPNLKTRSCNLRLGQVTIRSNTVPLARPQGNKLLATCFCRHFSPHYLNTL